MPAGTTGYEGAVTDEKIAAWCEDPEWQNENTALRSDGTWIGLDVDAYGDKKGHITLANLEARLGELPVTITSTARGQWLPDGTENPSRQHLYRVPAGLRFQTRFPDLEIIQATHRYTVTAPSRHPITGERYVVYGYDGEPLDDFPSIDDLEELPEAWLNFLAIPEGDQLDRDGFDGSVQEWLEACKPGSPSVLVQMVTQSIPRDPFGHDTMIALQASLVNLGAQGEPGVPAALAELKDEWLREPYNTPEYARDWSLGLSGAVAKFGAIEPQPEDVFTVDQAAAFGRIKDERFLDAWITLPPVVTEESLVERIRFISSMALASGLSATEAAALAWHTPSRRELGRSDAEALELVWVEAHAMETAPISAEREFAVEPEVVEVEPQAPGRRVKLLTTAEEGALEGITWWGDGKADGHFMSVMASVNPVMSEQYYHLNRWYILALCFANKAVIRSRNDTLVPLIIYGGILGPSGTGKSESINPVTEIASMFHLGDEDPDIGGDATAAGLTEALIRRDGKTSFFHSDEADRILNDWNNQQGEFRGMKQKVTEFYGGKVPALYRSTKKDISGIRARCYLCVHLMGVDQRVADAIEPIDWETGFINRFVWAKGYRKPRSREQKKFLSDGTDGAGKAAKKWYGQWVSAFQATASMISSTGEPARMDFDADVVDRHVDTIETFERMAQSSRHIDRLEPTFTRLELTILKCAALVALSDRRTRVKMADYLVALEQAEEWTENILELVDWTDKPMRAREADKIADFIRGKGGQVKKSEIHRTYPGDQFKINGLIKELEEQGRVEELKPGGVAPLVRLTEGER